MGAAASTNVRGRLEYTAKLEGQVQQLESERSEAENKAAIVAAEKESLAKQNIRHRQLAAEIRKSLAILEEEASVSKASLQEQCSKAKANEEIALASLAELRSEYDLLKLEVMASKMKHQAEMKEMEREIARMKIEQHEKLERLMTNYDLLVQQLLDNGRIVRVKVLELLAHVGDLADNFKLKQIKFDVEENLAARRRELNRYNSKRLDAHVFPAKEFLLLGDGGFRFRAAAQGLLGGGGGGGSSVGGGGGIGKDGDSISLDIAMEGVPKLDDQEALEEFRLNLIGDISQALTIGQTSVRVRQFGENQVRIVLSADPLDNAKRTAVQLAEELQGQVFAIGSPLRQGMVTGLIETISVVMIEPKRRRRKNDNESKMAASVTLLSSSPDAQSVDSRASSMMMMQRKMSIADIISPESHKNANNNNNTSTTIAGGDGGLGRYDAPTREDSASSLVLKSPSSALSPMGANGFSNLEASLNTLYDAGNNNKNKIATAASAPIVDDPSKQELTVVIPQHSVAYGQVSVPPDQKEQQQQQQQQQQQPSSETPTTKEDSTIKVPPAPSISPASPAAPAATTPGGKSSASSPLTPGTNRGKGDGKSGLPSSPSMTLKAGSKPPKAAAGDARKSGGGGGGSSSSPLSASPSRPRKEKEKDKDSRHHHHHHHHRDGKSSKQKSQQQQQKGASSASSVEGGGGASSGEDHSLSPMGVARRDRQWSELSFESGVENLTIAAPGGDKTIIEGSTLATIENDGDEGNDSDMLKTTIPTKVGLDPISEGGAKTGTTTSPRSFVSSLRSKRAKSGMHQSNLGDGDDSDGDDENDEANALAALQRTAGMLTASSLFASSDDFASSSYFKGGGGASGLKSRLDARMGTQLEKFDDDDDMDSIPSTSPRGAQRKAVAAAAIETPIDPEKYQISLQRRRRRNGTNVSSSALSTAALLMTVDTTGRSASPGRLRNPMGTIPSSVSPRFPDVTSGGESVLGTEEFGRSLMLDTKKSKASNKQKGGRSSAYTVENNKGNSKGDSSPGGVSFSMQQDVSIGGGGGGVDLDDPDMDEDARVAAEADSRRRALIRSQKAAAMADEERKRIAEEERQRQLLEDAKVEKFMHEWLAEAELGATKTDQSFEAMSPSSVSSYRDHVRLFVFGTYRDMMEERDETRRLLASVFEPLCSERGIAFVNVDVYRGIVADNSKAENALTLQCLLDEVERCSHFSFFVGEKYGWIPTPDMVYVEARRRPWLSKFREERQYHASVLEMLWHEAFSIRKENSLSVYLRDPEYSAGFPSELRRHFRETNVDRASKLKQLKQKMLTNSDSAVDNYGGPGLAIRSLKSWLQLSITAKSHTKSPDEVDLERELKSHTTVGVSHTFYPTFVGLEKFSPQLLSHLDPAKQITVPFVWEGEAGDGKTAVCSVFRQKFRGKFPSALWITYFVGSTRESRGYQRLCTHIMHVIKEKYKIDQPLPPLTSPALASHYLLVWIGMATNKAPLILFIDGLDAIEDDSGNDLIDFLPPSFPRECRVVIFTRPSPRTLKMKERAWLVQKFPCLSSSLTGSICEAHLLERMARSTYETNVLPKTLVEKVCLVKASSNPLFARTLLEELCFAFESDEEMDLTQIELLEPHELRIFFDFLLWKWESIFEADHHNLVRSVFSALATSRWGMTEAELMDYIEKLPAVPLQRFLLRLEFYFCRHAGYINIRHPSLLEAVRERYLPSLRERIDAHRSMAAFFGKKAISKRRLEEEPWHLAKAEMWLDLLNLISNMDIFIKVFESRAGQQDLRTFWNVMEEHKVNVTKGFVESRDRFERAMPSLEDILHVTQVLAVLLEQVGEPHQAVVMCQQVQKIAETTDPEHDNEGFAAICERLGQLLTLTWDEGEKNFALLTEARTNFDAALSVWNKKVETLKDIADAAAAEGGTTFTNAQHVMLTALCHVADLDALQAQVAVRQGDFEVAEELYKSAMECYISSLHPNHPLVASMHMGLAELWSRRRMFNKAETSARRAVMIRQIAFGWHHPDFASALLLLSDILEAEGEIFESQALEKRASRIMASFPDAVEAAKKRKQRLEDEREKL